MTAIALPPELRVLRLVGGLDPLVGGPTTSCVNSLLALARHGCRTRLILPNHPTQPCPQTTLHRLRDAGIEIDLLPGARPRTAYLRSVGFSPAVGAKVRRQLPHCHCVHVEGAWLHTTLAAVRAAKAGGRPVVMTPHETLSAFDLARGHSWLQQWLKWLLKRYYLRTLDSIVFSSALERRDSLPARPAPAWRVIPHPVYDESQHRPRERWFNPAPEAPFRLGYLGRLHAKKNVELLIDALADLPATVTLTIAGDGPADYAATLRQRARSRGADARITWLGFVTGAAKDSFVHDLDLLAMPSTYECFGMAAVEAMIAGTPVLVTPETGVAAAVEKHAAGRVVPPDPEAIVGAIRSLAGDRRQLPRLSKNARVAATEFSFSSHAAALAGLYAELARGMPQHARIPEVPRCPA